MYIYTLCIYIYSHPQVDRIYSHPDLKKIVGIFSKPQFLHVLFPLLKSI